MTNTGASPAAMFGGLRDDRLLPATAGDTVRFAPTVRVEERFLSGEIEVEAWMTNTTFTAKANDYNSVRSNKRRSSIGGRPIEDEDDDSDEHDDSDAHVRRSIERLQSLTGASDDEIRAMYEYLEDDPVLREQAVITLPDARVPRGGPTVEELITPDRVIQFITGRADTDDHVYAWGANEYEELAAADDDDDDDDENESCEQTSSGTSLSTEGQVYCWGSGSSTAISEPIHTYGSLELIRSPAGVGVINSPPVATDEHSKIGVTSDGTPLTGDQVNEWGREDGPALSTSTIVSQVLVQPAGCPCPFPALLHVQRHRSNDQYIYSCGWIIDESCLYSNSTTVVTAARGRGGGAGRVSVVDIPVSTGREITGDVIRRLLPDDVSPIGSQLFDGSLRDAERAQVLLDDEFAEQVAQTVSAGDDEVYCVCTPFDGSCLHLVDDGDTENVVKFKAGAELSKSVN
ncbi:hypothetical protein GRS48_05340 [Halorubrum sp. JWXQ-INN 858]|uniref:hypothetical protein n=1 Tax=Halorubrum sp. JWXQ-INN 858 TaxID=2690782 RepID=UPI0013577591|nr:hypothetical protein [Halorubrum sp. JWXQ-INN 858]MWV64249.1 hypothetical protein [Halorubrum sp. JWXQ-INN 858]